MPNTDSQGNFSNSPSASIAWAPPTPLFGRLEDEVHAALEIPGPGKVARRSEQHGRVTVVTASVHHAGRGRPVGEAVRLRDRQGVHVSTQADCPGRVADAERSHHPGPTDAGGDLEPP